MTKFNKKQKLIHNTIFIADTLVFALLFILHLKYVYTGDLSSISLEHYVLFFLGVFVIQYLYLTIFSLGYLICGLLTGYRFSSIRIAFMTWTKNADGRIRYSNNPNAGMTCQCKMIPPDNNIGQVPFVLLNLGGILLSVVFVSVAFVLFSLYFNIPVISSLLLVFLYTLINGIILDCFLGNAKRIANIKKDSLALRGHWLELKFNDPAVMNAYPNDLPEDWFYFPDNADVSNPLVAYLVGLSASRYLENMEFAHAINILNKILAPDTGLPHIVYMYYICDRLFCELVTSRNTEIIDRLHSNELLHFISNMQGSYTVLRTEFAYALLIENNPTKAAQIKAKFFDVSKNALSSTDVQAETNLLLHAENLYIKESEQS